MVNFWSSWKPFFISRGRSPNGRWRRHMRASLERPTVPTRHLICSARTGSPHSTAVCMRPDGRRSHPSSAYSPHLCFITAGASNNRRSALIQTITLTRRCAPHMSIFYDTQYTPLDTVNTFHVTQQDLPGLSVLLGPSLPICPLPTAHCPLPTAYRMGPVP